MIEAVLIIGAYLLGAIPQVYLLGRLKGHDLRREPDLHIALWSLSRPLALAGIIGDFAKGPIPVLVARGLGLEPWVQAGVGVGVVIGQMWPVFIPGSGGRGNSTALTMSLTLAPQPFLFGVTPILLSIVVRTIARLSRRQGMVGPPSFSLPLGMLVGFATFPLASLGLGQPGEVSAAFAVLFLAIVVRRLTAGLGADLQGSPHLPSLLLRRFLYDRSR